MPPVKRPRLGPHTTFAQSNPSHSHYDSPTLIALMERAREIGARHGRDFGAGGNWRGDKDADDPAWSDEWDELVNLITPPIHFEELVRISPPLPLAPPLSPPPGLPLPPLTPD